MLALRGNSLVPIPFGIGATGATGPYMNGLDQVAVTEENVKPFIRRALHVDIRAQRQANAILAMTNPEKWLQERKAKIDEMMTTLSDVYAKQLQRYYNAGYTSDESMEKATQDANALYERLLANLEADFPGGESFLGHVSGPAKVDDIKYKKLKEKYKKLKSNKVINP